MERIVVKAEQDSFVMVKTFIEFCLRDMDPEKVDKHKIMISVDEIFANIASYAYPDGVGDVELKINITDASIEIIFIDSGIPFNPLEKDKPDIKLPLEKRKIGGLGIYLTKKFMDDIQYEYKDNKNILTLVKNL